MSLKANRAKISRARWLHDFLYFVYREERGDITQGKLKHLFLIAYSWTFIKIISLHPLHPLVVAVHPFTSYRSRNLLGKWRIHKYHQEISELVQKNGWDHIWTSWLSCTHKIHPLLRDIHQWWDYHNHLSVEILEHMNELQNSRHRQLKRKINDQQFVFRQLTSEHLRLLNVALMVISSLSLKGGHGRVVQPLKSIQ
jgi:hypothetical protein